MSLKVRVRTEGYQRHMSSQHWHSRTWPSWTLHEQSPVLLAWPSLSDEHTCLGSFLGFALGSASIPGSEADVKHTFIFLMQEEVGAHHRI